MAPYTASAVAAPRPETKPEARPSASVRRMHSTPIGPTGAATAKPIMRPSRNRPTSTNLSYQNHKAARASRAEQQTNGTQERATRPQAETGARGGLGPGLLELGGVVGDPQRSAARRFRARVAGGGIRCASGVGHAGTLHGVGGGVEVGLSGCHFAHRREDVEAEARSQDVLHAALAQYPGISAGVPDVHDSQATTGLEYPREFPEAPVPFVPIVDVVKDEAGEDHVEGSILERQVAQVAVPDLDATLYPFGPRVLKRDLRAVARLVPLPPDVHPDSRARTQTLGRPDQHQSATAPGVENRLVAAPGDRIEDTVTLPQLADLAAPHHEGCKAEAQDSPDDPPNDHDHRERRPVRAEGEVEVDPQDERGDAREGEVSHETRGVYAVVRSFVAQGLVTATSTCSSLMVTITSPSSSRSEEHTSELQSRQYLVCRLLLE